jgi:hypothetical protein
MSIKFEQAFLLNAIPYPKVIVAPYEGDNDRARLRAVLQGKEWQNVTGEYLKSLYPNLSEAYTYLTPEGQAYFLPAFVKIAQTQPEQADTLSFAILSSISRGDSRTSALVDALNRKQREHLMAFFEEQFGGEAHYSQKLDLVRGILLGKEQGLPPSPPANER